MPVSKKKKYEPKQFTNTSGYKHNAHRDKTGKTQKERQEAHEEYLKNREISRQSVSLMDSMQIYNSMSGLVGISKRLRGKR